MIKILKHGNLRACRCSVCGCFFTYEKGDTLFLQTDVNEHKRFIYCPDYRDRGEI